MAAPLDRIDRAVIAEGVDFRAIERWVAARAAADVGVLGAIGDDENETTGISGRGTLEEQDASGGNNLGKVPGNLRKWQIMSSSGTNLSCLVHSLLTALSPTFRKCTHGQKDYLADYYRFHLLSRLLLAGRGINNISAGEREMAIRDCMTPGRTLSNEIIGSFANIYNISIKVYEGTLWSGFIRDPNAWILIFNPDGVHYESVRRNTDGAYITNARGELATFHRDVERALVIRPAEEVAMERAAAAASAVKPRLENIPEVVGRFNIIPSGEGYQDKLLPIVNQGLTLPPRFSSGCTHCAMKGLRILREANLNNSGALKPIVAGVSREENNGLQEAAKRANNNVARTTGISTTENADLAEELARSKVWCPVAPKGVSEEKLAILCAKIQSNIVEIKKTKTKSENYEELIDNNIKVAYAKWMKDTIKVLLDTDIKKYGKDALLINNFRYEAFSDYSKPVLNTLMKKNPSDEISELISNFIKNEYDLLNKKEIDIFDMVFLIIIFYKNHTNLLEIDGLLKGARKGGARRTRKRQQKKRRATARRNRRT